MLDNYNVIDSQEQNRLEAVRAALEIAKAAVSRPNNSDSPHQASLDMADVAEGISNLADAIQSALKK